MVHRVISLSNARGQAIALSILVLAIVVSLLGSYWLSLYAIHRATASTVSVAQLCLSGNEARRKQVELWQFVIAISHAPPHETAAEKRIRLESIHKFEAHLHKVFAPHNCAHITR